MNDDSTKRENFYALYIHIPFCRRKCNYCDFVSWIPSPQEYDEYEELLKIEMKMWMERVNPENIRTIYIGGGTPSFFGERRISSVLRDWIHRFTDLKEFSIEVNPDSLTKSFLDEMRALGVNRISIGIQSFSDRLLNILGRIHSAKDAIRALDLLETFPFLISADLMMGVPGQKLEDIERDLKILVSYPVSHISVYILELENGVPLAKMIKDGVLELPTDKETEEMFTFTHNFLKDKGFSHYEISNYSIPGFECRHNLSYWRGNYYIGVGVSAASYLPFDPLDGIYEKTRLKNEKSLKSYSRKLAEGELPVAETERIKGLTEVYEKFMLALRTRSGLAISEIEKIFGKRAEKLIRELEMEGLINDRISLKIPCEKWLLYNTIMARTFSIIEEFIEASQ